MATTSGQKPSSIPTLPQPEPGLEPPLLAPEPPLLELVAPVLVAPPEVEPLVLVPLLPVVLVEPLLLLLLLDEPELLPVGMVQPGGAQMPSLERQLSFWVKHWLPMVRQSGRQTPWSLASTGSQT